MQAPNKIPLSAKISASDLKTVVNNIIDCLREMQLSGDGRTIQVNRNISGTTISLIQSLQNDGFLSGGSDGSFNLSIDGENLKSSAGSAVINNQYQSVSELSTELTAGTVYIEWELDDEGVLQSPTLNIGTLEYEDNFLRFKRGEVGI